MLAVDVCAHLKMTQEIKIRSKHRIDVGRFIDIPRKKLIDTIRPLLAEASDKFPDLVKVLVSNDQTFYTQLTDELFKKGDCDWVTPALELSNLKIFMDAECVSNVETDKFFIQDTDTGRLSPLPYSTWYHSIPDSKDRANARLGAPLGIKRFDKGRSDGTWDDIIASPGGKDIPVLAFQEHEPPLWARVSLPADSSTIVLQDILDLWDIVFLQNKEQINAAKSWLHYAQTYRALTIPVLSGVKGAGKSLWVATNKLVFNHIHDPNRNSTDTRFNTFLSKVEYCPLEEFKIKPVTLRRYIGDYQAIERKGQDQVMERVWANFSVTVNPSTRVPLEPDERIFSVFDISNVDLKTLWSEEKLRTFYNAIEDGKPHKFKTDWYNYIKNFQPTIPNNKSFKGKRFRTLVLEGLSPKWAFLRETCLDTKTSISLKQLRTRFNEKSKNSIGSLYLDHEVKYWLIKMADIGEVIGTLVYDEDGKASIACRVDPRDDLSLL